MALTAEQRNKLPRSAFVYAPPNAPRSQWKYPAPTKVQAQKAGISESQRQRTLSAANNYAKRPTTAGSPRTVSRVVNKRK